MWVESWILSVWSSYAVGCGVRGFEKNVCEKRVLPVVNDVVCVVCVCMCLCVCNYTFLRRQLAEVTARIFLTLCIILHIRL